MSLTPDVINRHKLHYEPPIERVAGTRKRDFALLVRDKAIDQFEKGDLDLTDKDSVPGINAGIKAQSVLDRREVQKAKQQTGDAVLSLIAWLEGGVIPRQLESGDVVDGEAVEVN